MKDIGFEWVYPKDETDDANEDKIFVETNIGPLILAVTMQVIEGERPGSIYYRAVHPNSIKTES